MTEASSFPSMLDITIEEMRQLLEAHAITSVDLVTMYLARISEVNPILHAINDVNPDGLAIARELDEERASGKSRGPLHGIPILVKDVIATKDRMNNTAGAMCLVGEQVREEATVITKLRKAGVIILGKTNLTEWAGARSSSVSSTLGWSAYGGQTRGAYCEDQDPGGSSSGSGVAVSVGLAAAALGTENRGSIIIPAEWNNGVGIKPTLGLVSRHIVIFGSPSQDVVGPMARTVQDAAHLLSVVAGKDPKDEYTIAQPFDTPRDYGNALRYSSLQGARIGVPLNGIRPELYPAQSPEHMEIILRSFNNSITLLEEAGATIVHTRFCCLDDPSSQKPWDDTFSDTYADADFIPTMNNYLSNLDPTSTTIRDFDDVIEATMNDPREQYPARNIDVWKASKNTKVVSGSPEALEAYQVIYSQCGPNGVFGALEEHGLDALVLPSCLSFVLPAYAGSPVVTVPMGAFDQNATTVWRKKEDPQMKSVMAGPGMTFGLSFLGAKWSEERLLSLAYAYEQRTMVRTKFKPMIVPRRELGEMKM
ncbi:hypothetical protein MMC14_004691 [Varicellaria rhodocarpa]|nr:hypothetical protein [Varicellaria rhodocarpa]